MFKRRGNKRNIFKLWGLDDDVLISKVELINRGCDSCGVIFKSGWEIKTATGQEIDGCSDYMRSRSEFIYRSNKLGGI